MRFIGFLILMLATAFGGPRQEDAEGRIRVYLSIYSGRENPTWLLTDDQAREFAARFKSVGEDDPTRTLRQGLGYGGFIVLGFEGVDDLRFHDGTAQATRGGQIIRWPDKGRAMEKFLLETSKEHINEALYNKISDKVDPH